MNTRAERKAANRAECARQWPAMQHAARAASLRAALIRLETTGEDSNLAFQLRMKHGPARAAMENAVERARITGKPVTSFGCADDSREALLAIGERALERWKRQAGAIERAMSGKLGMRGGELYLFTCDARPLRRVPNPRVWGLVRLCEAIEDNLTKGRAVRLTFLGKVNPQVEQSVRMRAPDMVCPLAHVTHFVPYVRAKLREYHPRGEVDVKLWPVGSFQG